MEFIAMIIIGLMMDVQLLITSANGALLPALLLDVKGYGLPIRCLEKILIIHYLDQQPRVAGRESLVPGYVTLNKLSLGRDRHMHISPKEVIHRSLRPADSMLPLAPVEMPPMIRI